jgi:hypothetical protein
MELTQIVQDWVNQKRKHKVQLRYGQADAARLLKLKVWELLYKVEVTEILDLIVPILRGQRNNLPKGLARKRIGLLGVSVPALTGQAAERILQTELRKRYPEGEQEGYWQEQQREEDILREEALKEQEGDLPVYSKDKGMSLLNYNSVTEFVKQYDQRVEAERDRFNKAYHQKWRRRKRYRDNPWI